MDRLLQVADELDFVANAIQILIWIAVGAIITWRTMLKGKVSDKAELAKSRQDIQYWRGEFAKMEAENKSLAKYNRAMLIRLPETVSAEIKTQQSTADFEKAIETFDGWLSTECALVSELFCNAAELKLGFSDQEENENYFLLDAQRLANIAYLFTPTSSAVKNLKSEIDNTVSVHQNLSLIHI